MKRRKIELPFTNRFATPVSVIYCYEKELVPLVPYHKLSLYLDNLILLRSNRFRRTSPMKREDVMDLGSLLDIAKDIPPTGALFIISCLALGIVWKALNVVSSAVGRAKESKRGR